MRRKKSEGEPHWGRAQEEAAGTTGASFPFCRRAGCAKERILAFLWILFFNDDVCPDENSLPPKKLKPTYTVPQAYIVTKSSFQMLEIETPSCHNVTWCKPGTDSFRCRDCINHHDTKINHANDNLLVQVLISLTSNGPHVRQCTPASLL